MNDLPLLVTAIVAVASLSLPIALPVVLYRGALATGSGQRGATTLAATAAIILIGWLAVTYTLARSGQYAIEPWLGIGVLIPLVVGLIALRLLPVRRALHHPAALADLAVVQLARLVGTAFLVVLSLGQLPASFALPAGIGDVLVGVTALTVGRALRRDPDRRRLALTFNLLGIADLVVAIPLGLLHAPGRFHTIITDPTAEIMGLLPMALIPTFIVPLTLLAHIASLTLTASTRSAPVVAALPGS